jgi:outer membrane receptor for ferric coprogen and ferric-rhodotorulic acid
MKKFQQRSALQWALKVMYFGLAPLSLGLASIASHAQSPLYHYHIAAGRLNTVLAQFALQSHLSIAYAPQPLAHLHSTGLQGSYPVEQALELLLAPHGFVAIKLSNGGFSIVQQATNRSHQPDQEILQLQPISVTASDDLKSGDSTVAVLPSLTVQANNNSTEGSGSYTNAKTSTATRLNLAMKETPQATSVISQQRIIDQNMTSILDVVHASPGLYLSSSDGQGRQGFRARGFDLDNIMYDGIPSRYQGWTTGVQSNMAMFDRAEIVRGATGLVTGSGNPSAAINLYRKRPTDIPKLNLSASAGSWDNYRGEIDASNALNQSGSIRGRMVGSYQDQATFRDRERAKHQLYYAAIEADLSDKATLFTGLSYQKDYSNSFWSGLPLSTSGQHLQLSRSTNAANDWENKTTEFSNLFANLEYRFNDDWTVYLASMKAWNDAIFSGTYLRRRSATGGLYYSAYQATYDEDHTGVDLYAQGHFSVLGRQHDTSFGLSQREVKLTTQSYSGGGIIGNSMDAYALQQVAKPNFIPTTQSLNRTQQQGVNAMTRLHLTDELKLIIGGRLDWYDYKNYSGSGSFKVTQEPTRYVGMIYDLNPQHALYASYTTIFQPQSNKDLQQRVLDPITGNNYEIGIKGEYWEGRLNASAALFRINQQNRARLLSDQSGCPTYPSSSCYEASGEVRSDGIDLEIQGALSPQWQLAAGYSYVDATYRKDANTSLIGTLFDTDTPKQMFKLTTAYQLPNAWYHWRLATTLYWQSQIYNLVTYNGAATSARVDQAAYALMDLMLHYQANSHLELQLNINNVFDKVYYRGLGYDTGWGPADTYGDPRNAVLTVRYHF